MTIIARIPEDRVPAPPEDVMRLAREVQLGEVDSCLTDALGATCWVVGKWVHPHIDPDWRGQIFVTLGVEGEFYFGDANAVTDDDVEHRRIVKGTLFLIDPMVPHWAFPVEVEKPKPFIVLQWQLPRRAAKRKMRQLCDELGAQIIEGET